MPTNVQPRASRRREIPASRKPSAADSEDGWVDTADPDSLQSEPAMEEFIRDAPLPEPDNVGETDSESHQSESPQSEDDRLIEEEKLPPDSEDANIVAAAVDIIREAMSALDSSLEVKRSTPIDILKRKAGIPFYRERVGRDLVVRAAEPVLLPSGKLICAQCVFPMDTFPTAYLCAACSDREDERDHASRLVEIHLNKSAGTRRAR